MKIKPTYVTFEQAKMLQEKGFNVPCQFLYVNGKYRINFENEGDLFNNRYPSTQIPNDWCLAPEQWQVIEWLRVKKGIDVSTKLSFKKTYIVVVTWKLDETHVGMGNMDYYSNQEQLNNDYQGYNSPQQAYLAAFDYILKELI